MGYSLIAGLFLLLTGVVASQVVRGVQSWRRKRLAAPSTQPALSQDGPVSEQGEVSILLEVIDDAELADSVRRFLQADMAWRRIEANLPTIARARGEQLIDLMMASCRRMAETPGLAASAEARRQLQGSLERVTALLQGHAADMEGKAVDEFVAELRAVDRNSAPLRRG